MAGRILPIALATVAGVSIGVATFGEELKQQRWRRLQEEYDREVAAQAALAGQSVTPMTSNAMAPPSPPRTSLQQDARTADQKAFAPEPESSWSTMLGLWAWKKRSDTHVNSDPQRPVSSESTVLEPPRKP